MGFFYQCQCTLKKFGQQWAHAAANVNPYEIESVHFAEPDQKVDRVDSWNTVYGDHTFAFDVLDQNSSSTQ